MWITINDSSLVGVLRLDGRPDRAHAVKKEAAIVATSLISIFVVTLTGYDSHILRIVKAIYNVPDHFP